jgi:chromosome segregation ATPase
VSETEYMQMFFQGTSVLCDYVCKMQEIEKERFRIMTEAEIMHRKISITEKLAIEKLAAQRMVLEKSMEVTARELSGLQANKEILFRTLDKLVHNIIADNTTIERQEILLRAIAIIKDEIQNLREDTTIQFNLIANSVMEALGSPINCNFISGGTENEYV